MAAQVQIDQAGLPPGVPGTSRTDGDPGGFLVALTNTGSGSTTRFRLLWTPPGDVDAVATLAIHEDPRVWTFTPTPNKYGSYHIELIEDEGLVTELRERRVFVIRTPVRGLVIPALNERGDPRASLVVAGTAQVEAADNNAVDYPDPDVGNLPYAAWWRAIHELTMAVDSSGVTPFSNILYVDKRTQKPLDEQTGSIGAPFSTLQAAIDAIPEITDLGGYSPQGGVLLIVGNEYSSESLVLSTNVAFVAVGSPENIAGQVVLGTIDCQGFDAEFKGVKVANPLVNASTVYAHDSFFFSHMTVAGGFICNRCEIGSGFTTSFFRAANCRLISGEMSMDVGEIINSDLDGSAVFTSADALLIDHYSYTRAAFEFGTEFTAVGALTIVDRAGTFSVGGEFEVVVPELIGAATAFVDVNTTGTSLDGVDTQTLVLVNPTDDDMAGGVFLHARVSDVDTLRFAFAGPYAGGPVIFRVARLY